MISGSPGKSRVTIPLATMLNGTDLFTTMHVVNGCAPGPTLSLLSTSHGAEFLSIEQVRAVIAAIDPTKLRGRVLAIPVANPSAFQESRVNTPQDEANMNRVFPGRSRDRLRDSYAGGLTEFAAHQVTSNLIDPADLVIDFHLGPWGQAVECIDLPAQAEGEGGDRLLSLAGLFGVTIHRWTLPPGSSVAYALTRGKMGLGVEIGGGGFGDEQSKAWVRQARDGVLAVMTSLGMLEGEPPATKEVWLCTDRAGLRPVHGGYHEPEFGVREFGGKVKAGAVLGRTYHTQTFDLLEEIRAPYDGILYLGRGYGPIQPGDWGYVIGDLAASRRYRTGS